MTTSLHDSVVELARRAAEGSPEGASILARLTEPLAVALAGRVNAGKSTLLNALIGERLALTDATECTRVVARYSHGQRYSATAPGPGGQFRPLAFERGPDGLRVAIADGEPGVSSIRVTAPNAALRVMTLIDTPGVGSDDSARMAATTSALGINDDRRSDADAVVYLLRHAHRTDLDTLEALRDRWAGNGSAFNVVAVLSRADEIGSGRLDAMESAAEIAARYESDGRLRGLATRVVPVSGLLAETGATLREDEFAWLRTFAAGSSAEVDRLLLATGLLLGQSSSPLTVEVRRLLLQRFGLFGVRLAVAALRDGTVSDAPGLARLLVETSGLSGLRDALSEQFGQRARVLQALTAMGSLRRLATSQPSESAWVRGLERVEAASYEVAEIRALQSATDGLLDLAPAQQQRLTLLLAATDVPARLGIPGTASRPELRDFAISAISEWRTLAADPIFNRPTLDACETAARAAERIFADLAE